MNRNLLIAVAVLCSASLTCADDISPEQQAREAAFAERYSQCNLVGSFTLDGKDSAPAKPERYEIESVRKLTGNLWVFTVRIKYGKLDTKLPITVPVVWAGDTPMVSLTDASLPGLGAAFSARVIFYEDRYAGTWQHGDKGGHMFGSIRKAAKDSSESGESPQKEANNN